MSYPPPQQRSISSPPSPHHYYDETTQQDAQQQQQHYQTPQYNYSPSPSTTCSSSRRSSICTPLIQTTTHEPTPYHHRRTRSFRDPQLRSRSPTYGYNKFEFEQEQLPKSLSTSSSKIQQILSNTNPQAQAPQKPRPNKQRPPPLKVYDNVHHPYSTSISSSASTTTTFFNTSTESTSSGTNNKKLPYNQPVSQTSSRSQSSYSITSEYSTTSTSSKRIDSATAARVAAAGGKLAYLASRRSSNGSVSSSVGGTPPNTPGSRFASGCHSRRRQSSGNFLEVPPTSSSSSTNTNNTYTKPPHPTRPRVNSLPATSLLLSPTRLRYRTLLSPTNTYVEDEYEDDFDRFASASSATPYNPRSHITKSQDHLYRLRTFNITKQGGVVNCGDTIVRKSKSNNCISDNNGASESNPGVSPRKTSLSTSPNRSERSSPCRRGSLSPRLVVNYTTPFDGGCCVKSSRGGDSDEFDDFTSERECGGSSVGDDDEDVDDDEDEFDDITTMRELVSACEEDVEDEGYNRTRYRVVLLGESGVGKSALVRQFMTSEYINTYDMSLDEEYGEREVSVLLDSKESQLVFIDHPHVEMSVENSLATYEPHACVVVYSVTDKRSFDFASEVLRYLWQEGTTQERSVILVGNKCDLARVRAISTQEGKHLATSYETKFIETSSGIQHNVDELLVGVLKQIRLREEASIENHYEYSHNSHHASSQAYRKKNRKKCKNRGGVTPRGSIMGLLFTRELINKLCFLSNKAKSCENLHVL